MTATMADSANPMSLAYASNEDMTFNSGRRAWIKYRDLGVKAATHGALSGEIMHIDDGSSSQPTGWHYHTADIQFLYSIDGWVQIEFADRGIITLKTGESIMIPRGTIHRELRSSEPLRLLEIFSPAATETVPVDEAEALAVRSGNQPIGLTRQQK